jgi:hypothetical protein
MAHFAKIENNIVKNVIVIKNEDCGGGEFPTSEPIGQAFIASLGFAGEWLQTSYNASFRGKFAGIGMSFNGTCFYGKSPYPSWVLDANGDWNAPTPKPDGDYYWDEPSISWKLFTPTL